MTLEQRVEQLAGRVQKLDDVITQEKYRDLVTGLRLGSSTSESTPASQEKKDSSPRTPDELRQKFRADIQEGSRLRVGIIGRVKAGKSSLLNALLFDGKDILPKAATPMTASLTVLGYAETPHAEVEFFEQNDIENMRQRAQDYDQEFKRRVNERLEKNQSRVQRPGIRPAPMAADPARIEAAVRRELDDDPTLGGSKKLFDDIQKAGGYPPTASQRIESDGIQALLGKLGDYVGAQGKFTPFTKCMSIYLPLEVLKDLEKQKAHIGAYRGNPAISEASLDAILTQLDDAFQKLNQQLGKPGHELTDNEWLMSIRSRAVIPGGTCGFDLPAYHAWQQGQPAARRADLQAWAASLAPMAQAITLLLQILRDSGKPQKVMATAGQFQQTLPQGRTFQLLRLRIDPSLGLVPEISGNRLLVSVRLMRVDGDGRLQPCQDDAAFELTLCA